MVLVCLPSDALSQQLLSYLGFSYLRRGVSLHSCSSKAQPLLLTLDEGYLLTAAPADLERGVPPLRVGVHISRVTAIIQIIFGKVLDQLSVQGKDHKHKDSSYR